MGQVVGCVEGMSAAARALDFPVVSGNVSLYNETNGSAILPTPTIGGLGVVDDLAAVPATGFTADGEAIVLIGETARSEERRVGKECVSTCRSRWSPSH